MNTTVSEATATALQTQLQKANDQVKELKNAQAGIMARDDDFRRKNEDLLRRVGELEAEALLPMPPARIDNSFQDLTANLKKARADLTQALADNAQLVKKNAELGNSAERSKEDLANAKIELVKCQSQLQMSGNGANQLALDANKNKKLELENEILLDRVTELETATLGV